MTDLMTLTLKVMVIWYGTLYLPLYI